MTVTIDLPAWAKWSAEELRGRLLVAVQSRGLGLSREGVLDLGTEHEGANWDGPVFFVRRPLHPSVVMTLVEEVIQDLREQAGFRGRRCRDALATRPGRKAREHDDRSRRPRSKGEGREVARRRDGCRRIRRVPSGGVTRSRALKVKR